jgi:hypothetical protein
MLKTLARFALLRFLPRRILPIVTLVEVALFLRSIRKRGSVRINEPAASRTGKPPAHLTETDAEVVVDPA